MGGAMVLILIAIYQLFWGYLTKLGQRLVYKSGAYIRLVWIMGGRVGNPSLSDEFQTTVPWRLFWTWIHRCLFSLSEIVSPHVTPQFGCWVRDPFPKYHYFVEVLFDTSQWGMRAIYAEQLWQVGRHFSPRKMKKLHNPSASWTVWPRISGSSIILHLVPMRTGFARGLETPWHEGVFVDWQEVTVIATTSRRAVMWLQHWYLIKV